MKRMEFVRDVLVSMSKYNIMVVKKIKTNPKKETLACGWEVSFDKNRKGKIKSIKWTHEVLEDWKPETGL